MKTDQVRQLVNQGTETLIAELEAGRSRQLVQYLAAMGRFHRYSLGNAILIWLQMPTASRVAGFHTWHQVGRRVRKGERGIAILAPIVRRVAKDDQDEEESEVVAFKSTHVFDISQTEGQPLPEFAAVRGEPGSHLQRLHEFLELRGIRVDCADLGGSIQGLSMGGKIVVRSNLPPAEQFSVTVHEAAHELLNHHDKTITASKTVRETEAEAVAFVVSAAIGLETNHAASDYIKLYDGKKETLLASLERIRDVSSEIIRGILDPDPGKPIEAVPEQQVPTAAAAA